MLAIETTNSIPAVSLPASLYSNCGKLAVGLVAHRVDRLQAAGFTVEHVPIDGNDYHGEARGKPSTTERRALAATCEIIVALDGDEARRHEDEKLAREAQKRLRSA
jgi:hypothetical protein